MLLANDLKETSEVSASRDKSIGSYRQQRRWLSSSRIRSREDL